MFRIVFVAMSGGEREVVIVAASRIEAVMTATALKDFGLCLSCTKLSTMQG